MADLAGYTLILLELLLLPSHEGGGVGGRGGTGTYALWTLVESRYGAAEPPGNGAGGLNGYAGGNRIGSAPDWPRTLISMLLSSSSSLGLSGATRRLLQDRVNNLKGCREEDL